MKSEACLTGGAHPCRRLYELEGIDIHVAARCVALFMIRPTLSRMRFDDFDDQVWAIPPVA